MLEPSLHDYPLTTGRVLIVEDEGRERRRYVSILRDAGFTVSSVSTAEAAVRCLATRGFDAILSDVGLPGMDGLELLRRVRRDSQIPMVMLADEPDNRKALHAAKLGSFHWIVKPVEPLILRQAASMAVSSALHSAWGPGPQHDLRVVSATDAKNEFGRILEWTRQGHCVIIERHSRPKAVLVSYEDFGSLGGGSRSASSLARAVAEMQRPEARQAALDLFRATPTQLGQAAVRAARGRG